VDAVYVLGDMLGHEPVLVTLCGAFRTKMFVDAQCNIRRRQLELLDETRDLLTGASRGQKQREARFRASNTEERAQTSPQPQRCTYVRARSSARLRASTGSGAPSVACRPPCTCAHAPCTSRGKAQPAWTSASPFRTAQRVCSTPSIRGMRSSAGSCVASMSARCTRSTRRSSAASNGSSFRFVCVHVSAQDEPWCRPHAGRSLSSCCQCVHVVAQHVRRVFADCLDRGRSRRAVLPKPPSAQA